MCLFQCANHLSSRRGWLTFYLYLSIHCLYAQPNAEALSSQTVTTHQGSMTTKQRWQGWSFCSEIGTHFKTLDFSNAKAEHYDWGHDTRFWGEFGGMVGVGLNYGRVFKEHFYWGVKMSWTFFYPDVRWSPGSKSDITLGSIPFIGKHIKFATDVEGNWSQFIKFPLVYFDVGYITKNNVIFALGSAYLWGLSPSMTVPLSDKWSLEIRSLVFLDRMLFGLGYHDYISIIGLNYKF